MGFEISCGATPFHIKNVYMQVDCNVNLNDFMYYLYKIHNPFQNMPCIPSIISGNNVC